jgi:hypothetical protein
MNAKSAAKYRYLTRIANHETRNIRARAIPYGSYTETAAANALVLIGLGVLAVAMFSILIKFRIL